MNDNQNTNNNDRPAGEIRIGDAERNEAVRLLGEHYEAGRLSQEEHSERVDAALRAANRNDLDGLFGDLPRDAAEAGWQGPGSYQQPGPAGAQDAPGWQGWFGPRGQQGSQGQAGAEGPQGPRGGQGGGYRSGAPFGGPPWARGGWRGPRGPFGLPVPLIAILALLAVAGILCTVIGGHPPVLLFLVAGATAFAIIRRRFPYRA